MVDPTIDELLDQAVHALNRGDVTTASRLARRVLAVDRRNPDAEDVLGAKAGRNELRRLTIMFADVVDSTALSTRIEPETYFTVIGRYRDQVAEIVERYEGHIFSTKGDGLLAVFGHPIAHANDVQRAVRAALDITRDVATLSERVRTRFGFDIAVRVGVHRGLVYLDKGGDDVYGLGANLASRVSGLAPPGGVVVSAAIERLVGSHFDLERQPARSVKGIEDPVEHYLVVGERLSPARKPLGPLVGRVAEQRFLAECWERAAAGALSAPGVALYGEPGLGKSRLATAAADLAIAAGRPVLALIGSVFHADAGLHPLRSLLQSRCGISRVTEQPERLELLRTEVRKRGLDAERAVPLLAPVLGISAEHGYSPVAAQGAKLYEQIAEMTVEYVLNCFGGGAGVLLVEDVQWFDPSTMDLVATLLKVNSPHLLVVLTSRDAGALPDVPDVRRFELAPLSGAETRELVGALSPELTAEQRLEISRRCDGVPLYIEELVTKISHEHETDARDHVPDSLYEALFARLRASDNAIPVVQAAATIGRDFDRHLLSSVVDLPADDTDEAIRKLERALVFEPTGRDVWRFRHELLREVAYELPPPSVRRNLHAAVADALVRTSGDDACDWRLVAFHYDRAERFDTAATSYQMAAADARRRGALEESRRHLTNALTQVERLPEGTSRNRTEVKLRLRRGFLASAAEGTTSPQAAADFERCLQLCRTDLDQTDLFAAMTALWAYYLPRGDIASAVRMSHSVGDTLNRVGAWFQPYTQAGFGMVAWYQGHFTSSRSLLEDSVAALGVLDGDVLDAVWFVPNEPIASTHTHLALARAVQGEMRGAEEQFAAAQARAAQLAFPQGPFSHAYSQCYEVWMLLEAGRFDRAATVIAEMAVAAERHGFDSFAFIAATEQAATAGLTALAATPRGDLTPHIGAMAMFVDAWRGLGSKLFVNFYDGVLIRLLIGAGRLDEARIRVAAALELAEETGSLFYHAELLRLRAQLHDDRQDAIADLASAVQVARGQRAHVFELRAATDDFELRGDDARQALEDAVSRMPADGGWPELDRARGLLG